MNLEIFLAKKRAKVVNKLIPMECRKGRILDIGCGEYQYFLLNTDFKEKHGIDRAVKNCNKYISIKKCDIEKEGLGDFNSGYFDVVTMLAVFEHIEPDILPDILHEIKRILKPGGIFILTTPAPWTSLILKTLSACRLLYPAMIKEHKALYGKKTIACLLSESGFNGENIKSGNFELFMNIWSMAVKEGA